MLATCIVATGWIVRLRHEAPQAESSRPAATRQEPQRSATAQDILTEFSRIAGETDRVRRDARLLALAGRWSDAGPEDALDFAFGLPPGEVRDIFLRQLCVAWARKDAEKALAWSDRLDDAADRRQISSTVCIAVAESDPHLALGLALRHGSEDDDSGGLLENISAQWADREPTAALDWVRTQPGGEWHDRLLARVAFVLSRSDPHTAACRVAKDMEPGTMQDEAVISILHQWIMKDPQAAATWAAAFPEGDLHSRALNEFPN
ncbi:hypothetical protein [Luteolibacter sp.]|uniref:hypothetical protein n=1 Tax=Luteolibacter sp. TaxID=1962973 RepID=UPI0032653C81